MKVLASRTARNLRLLILAAVVVTLGGVLFACSQTPTSVPIRTFQRAQRMDSICLRVIGENVPEPVPQDECAPVPASSDTGGDLVNQLFALVTQTARGEVAVVDLSSSVIIDRSHATPGINFLPVGAIPTDIAATPDGRMAFVAAAEVNKYAIYGLPGHRILGDALGHLDPEGAVTLGTWPVCSLPQRPGSLSVVTRGTGLAQYELVAVLPGDRTTSAKIITIDPKPFLRADRRKLYTGPQAGQYDVDFGPGPTLTPGVLEPCPITAAIDISGDSAVPSSYVPGPRWDDGVKYVDGGVDLTCAQPDPSSRCGTRPCGCAPDIVQADGGAAIPTDGGLLEPTCDTDAGTATDGGTEDGGGADAGDADASVPLDFGPLDPPQPIAVALDDQTLYIADDSLPLIHVFDLSTQGAPRELPPLTMTSVSDATRVSPVRDLSISPTTRDFKRFLYAVDSKDGTIAVFDITDPNTTVRVPQRRPHPELNPFQPEDRLGFGAPVVAVAFAKHDFPLTRENGIAIPNAPSGLLCNPNPNLSPTTNPGDWGVGYRADSTDTDVEIGPLRLRGIFAFVTLSNGQTVVVDVDDWDAPCRRPQYLSSAVQIDSTGVTSPNGVLAVPEPTPGPGDEDPYHAPTPADLSGVTQEIYFPVSAPHRIRSDYLLRNDTVSGDHIPYTPSTPQIQGPGTPLPIFGQGSEATPHIRPTAPTPGVVAGTEDIGIRFSTDVPDTQFDQDWTVQYEGPLPGFEPGLPSPLTTTDGFQTINVVNPNAHFCSKGVEDWQVSGEHANQIVTALAQSGRNGYPERLDRRMTDYVQVVDDLLPAIDQYWPLAETDDGQQCWDPTYDTAAKRYDACLSEFGTFSEQLDTRDFPILEAYDDHLVVGTFATIAPNKTREIVSQSTYNQPYLKLMRCCFHHQINFNVRAASQWVTTGSTLGFMSHMTTDPATNRCVPSCDPRDQLLNSRAPSLPYGGETDFAPFRDTPLALRNPSFSFFIQNGYLIDTSSTTAADGSQVKSPTFGQAIDQIPTRDTFYHFQSRGEFTPLIVDLTQGNAANTVDPQSTRFIDPLGQVAVVDGSAQGLILIDLSVVGIVKGPYY